jgi:hypothetical protein
MKRIALCVFTIALALVAVVHDGRAQSTGGKTIYFGDNNQYSVKFNIGGNSGSVRDNKHPQPIGFIMAMGGELQIMGLAGPDAEGIKKAFEAWKCANGQSVAPGCSAVTAAATASPTQPEATQPAGGNAPPQVAWDDAKTVTLPNGTAVNFTDADNAKLRFPGSNMECELHYHPGGAGGFMTGYVNRMRGNSMTSLGGSGVEISYNGVGAANTADGNVAWSTTGGALGLAKEIVEAAKLADAKGIRPSDHIVTSLKRHYSIK